MCSWETLRGPNRQLVRADEAHRKRVARDLHDTVLQQLFFVKQGLFREQEHTGRIELLEETIQTLRRTIRGQRPPLLDQGLRLALQGLVEDMQRLAGSSPTISWNSELRERLSLSDQQATALYRIAQEALTNALKHADAQNVTVALHAKRDGAIELCIADDGVGMLASARERAGHYGVTGMRERAAMIGAQLYIVSTPGAGARHGGTPNVRATLPAASQP